MGFGLMMGNILDCVPTLKTIPTYLRKEVDRDR